MVPSRKLVRLRVLFAVHKCGRDSIWSRSIWSMANLVQGDSVVDLVLGAPWRNIGVALRGSPNLFPGSSHHGRCLAVRVKQRTCIIIVHWHSD